MIDTSDKNQLKSALRNIEPFAEIDDQTLDWVLDHSEIHTFDKGEQVFKPGTPTDHMIMMLEGRVVARISQNNEWRELGSWENTGLLGVLPFSRMVETKASGTVIEPVTALFLHKDCFTDMVNVSYELVQNLVAQMSDRIRNFTHKRVQDEKLIALGKLSAGLAHELNNPASAMERSAEELHRKVHGTPERFKAILEIDLTEEKTDNINKLLFERIENRKPDTLTLMEREECTDDLLDWLEDHDIDDADELAETFVAFDITTEDLDYVLSQLKAKDLSVILWWLESTLSLERLVTEIKESADRISKLVKSVKGYTHMDRGSEYDCIDIREGIISTLTMLKHKIKQKDIKLDNHFDDNLPAFRANPGQLNQIWTNIIDNAIDAMDEGGTLTIRTERDREFICVDIEDNGAGIPEDIQSKIFDPFYTTKAVGKGTGMGLEIVRRFINDHKGKITVSSEPGRTIFRICLPGIEK